MVNEKLSSAGRSIYDLFTDVRSFEMKHPVPCILARSTFAAGVTYVGFTLFSTTNPLIAAGFAATYILVSQVVKQIFHHYCNHKTTAYTFVRDGLFLTSINSLVFYAGKASIRQPLNSTLVWITSMIGSNIVPFSILIFKRIKKDQQSPSPCPA